jgi:hypothetical protein
VHVHAAAVVADDRLGHEGGGLAVAVGDVLDDVLQRQQLVGLLDQRVELGADLALAGGGDLVVVHLDSMPTCSSVRHISPRRSCSESTGATGK